MNLALQMIAASDGAPGLQNALAVEVIGGALVSAHPYLHPAQLVMSPAKPLIYIRFFDQPVFDSGQIPFEGPFPLATLARCQQQLH